MKLLRSRSGKIEQTYSWRVPADSSQRCRLRPLPPPFGRSLPRFAAADREKSAPENRGAPFSPSKLFTQPASGLRRSCRCRSGSSAAFWPRGSRAPGRRAGDRSGGSRLSPGRNRRAGTRARRCAPRCPDRDSPLLPSSLAFFSPRMVSVFSLATMDSSGTLKPATATDTRYAFSPVRSIL